MQTYCELLQELQAGAARCQATDVSANNSAPHRHPGCLSMWDNVSCWPASAIGETVDLPCPSLPSFFAHTTANISRQCTSEGWTELITSYSAACGFNPNSTEPDVEKAFLEQVRLGYTVGHGLSLIFLIAAVFLLSLLRKLHCTRNYIHINLFLSFILKAISVFVKDAILFSGDMDECSLATAPCKVAMAFFQFSVTSNFCWLLAEAVYLHTLVAVSVFIDNQNRGSYFAIAWVAPALITLSWCLVMLRYNDVGCWDSVRSPYFWIIKAPISLTILVTFILFISIVHVLIQKVHSSDKRGSERQQYLRLTRSTLLLIPLFGVNYMIFAFVPDHLNSSVRLVFDLTLGSFQGSIVATLYCFLNGEVQGELAGRWQRCCVQWYLPGDTRNSLPTVESPELPYNQPPGANNGEAGSKPS